MTNENGENSTRQQCDDKKKNETITNDGVLYSILQPKRSIQRKHSVVVAVAVLLILILPNLRLESKKTLKHFLPSPLLINNDEQNVVVLEKKVGLHSSSSSSSNSNNNSMDDPTRKEHDSRDGDKDKQVERPNYALMRHINNESSAITETVVSSLSSLSNRSKPEYIDAVSNADRNQTSPTTTDNVSNDTAGTLNVITTNKSKSSRMDIHSGNPPYSKHSLHQSLCNESLSLPHVLTNYTQDAILGATTWRETLMFMDEEPILKSSIAGNNSGSNISYLTCRIHHYRFSDHFAHHMQQLYRCWSFWYIHRSKRTKSTTISSKSHHRHYQPVFMMSTSTKLYKRARQKEFNRALWELLPTMGVWVVEPDVNITTLEMNTARKNSSMGTNNVSNATTSTKDISLSGRAVGPFLGPTENAFQSTSMESMKNFRDSVFTALKNTSSSISGWSEEELDKVLQSPKSCQTAVPRISIVNRKRTRHLRNSPTIADAIKDSFQGIYPNETLPTIEEHYFEGKSFAQQVATWSSTDIVITPHGAQETGVVFLPDCGGILELIPENYFYPKFFGTLAASAGIHHSYIYLSANASNTNYWLNYRNGGEEMIRNGWCPPVDKIVEGVMALSDAWRQCCYSN